MYFKPKFKISSQILTENNHFIYYLDALCIKEDDHKGRCWISWFEGSASGCEWL